MQWLLKALATPYQRIRNPNHIANRIESRIHCLLQPTDRIVILFIRRVIYGSQIQQGPDNAFMYNILPLKYSYEFDDEMAKVGLGLLACHT